MEEYSKGSKEIELMNPIPLNKPETNQCGDSEMSLLPLHKLPDSSPGHRFKLVKSQTASRIDISSNGKEVIGSPTLNLLKKGTLNQPAQRQSFNSLSVSANRFDSMRMARRRSKKGAHRRKRKVVNTDRGWTCIRGIVKGSHRIYKVVDEIGKYGFPFHNDTATLHEFLKPALRQSEGAQDTEESYPFYLIHPNGVFKLIWSVILILLLLYTAFVTPLRVAFFDSESEDNLGWKVTEYLIDGLFGLDIIVNLLSMYYDSEDKLR